MARIVEPFDLARGGAVAPPRIGLRKGYWHGEPSMRLDAHA